MSRIIEMLHEEHRNIASLLDVLERELSVFDRRERPDYEIFQADHSVLQGVPGEPAIIRRRMWSTRS